MPHNETNPAARLNKALEAISSYYPNVDLSLLTIEFSDEIDSLGRYYYSEESGISKILARSIPSLGRIRRRSRRIKLSSETLNDPELSVEFEEVDAVEVVLHHEILHYLIDMGDIECTEENEDIWIDRRLKEFYQEKKSFVDKYDSGLPMEEAKRLEGLIERFNSDDAYRREIMMMGNSMVVDGRSSTRKKTAEEYLAMLAFMSRY